MHSLWQTSIRFTLLTTFLVGVGYPLAITGIAGLVFPRRAAGTLIVQNGTVIGSRLIGQSFGTDRYFHPRPSAAGNGYDATASGGSNLAQSNASLVKRMQGDIDRLHAENPSVDVPIDLVTASGSGLDPDITPDAAYFQVPRVANARGISQETLRSLVAQFTTGRQWGLFGEPRVNVLSLNLALDALKK
ncbi:MAG: potassium-transporting ATPase subunit KdpC [Terracidiphilus sp.]